MMSNTNFKPLTGFRDPAGDRGMIIFLAGLLAMLANLSSCSKHYHSTDNLKVVDSADGDRTSSGGDGIACFDAKTKAIKSVDFLDYKYAEIKGHKIDLGGSATDLPVGYLIKKFEKVFERVKQIDPELYQVFSGELSSEESSLLKSLERYENDPNDKFITFIDTVDASGGKVWDFANIKDANLEYEISRHYSNQNCYLVQIAKQKKEYVGGMSFIEIDKKYVKHLSKDHYAGLLIHELLISFARFSIEGMENAVSSNFFDEEKPSSKVLKTTDSIRNFNIIISSADFKQYIENDCSADSSGMPLILDMGHTLRVSNCAREFYFDNFLTKIIPVKSMNFGILGDAVLHPKLYSIKKKIDVDPKERMEWQFHPQGFMPEFVKKFHSNYYLGLEEFHSMVDHQQLFSEIVTKPNYDVLRSEEQVGLKPLPAELLKYQFDLYSSKNLALFSDDWKSYKNDTNGIFNFNAEIKSLSQIEFGLDKISWENLVAKEKGVQINALNALEITKLLDRFSYGDRQLPTEFEYIQVKSTTYYDSEDNDSEKFSKLKILSGGTLKKPKYISELPFNYMTITGSSILLNLGRKEERNDKGELAREKLINEYFISLEHQAIVNLSLDPEGQIVFGRCPTTDFGAIKVATENVSDLKCLIAFETKHTPKELVELHGFSLDPQLFHVSENDLERSTSKPSWTDRETFRVIVAKGTKVIIAVQKNSISE